MNRLLLAAVLMGTMASPALAQGSFAETYCAYLSGSDHYNSNGARLTTPAQVIRQDRANFHRFGIRDDGDDWDSFFDNANNRARLETLVNKTQFSAAEKKFIVDNESYICVDVFTGGNSISGIEVYLPE